MRPGSLCHELFGADVIKGHLQQGIAAHFDDGQDHALAKGCVHDHIPLVEFRRRSAGGGLSTDGRGKISMALGNVFFVALPAALLDLGPVAAPLDDAALRDLL